MTALELATEIKTRRKQLGIDQATLAELSDTSIPTLSRLETGSANPTLGVLNRVLDVLGLELKVCVKPMRSSEARRMLSVRN